MVNINKSIWVIDFINSHENEWHSIRKMLKHYLCLMLSGTKIFHQEWRFCRVYSIGGESAIDESIDSSSKSSISLSSTNVMLILGLVEFLRRRLSNFVCHAVDARRRLSFSGVDVNNVWRDGPADGGEHDNCDDWSLSSLPIKDISTLT